MRNLFLKQYFIYILSNKNHSVFYTGMTSNLMRRVYEHKQKLVDGFTKRYNIDKLIYYEVFSSPLDAITREKQIKDYRREKRIKLINSLNPHWNDLYEEISRG